MESLTENRTALCGVGCPCALFAEALSTLAIVFGGATSNGGGAICGTNLTTGGGGTEGSGGAGLVGNGGVASIWSVILFDGVRVFASFAWLCVCEGDSRVFLKVNSCG